MNVPLELFTSLMKICQLYLNSVPQTRARVHETNPVALLPNFGMLATEDAGVKETVALAGDGLCVWWTSNFHALAPTQSYPFWDKRVVEGIEMESRL